MTSTSEPITDERIAQLRANVQKAKAAARERKGPSARADVYAAKAELYTWLHARALQRQSAPAPTSESAPVQVARKTQVKIARKGAAKK